MSSNTSVDCDLHASAARLSAFSEYEAREIVVAAVEEFGILVPEAVDSNLSFTFGRVGGGAPQKLRSLKALLAAIDEGDVWLASVHNSPNWRLRIYPNGPTDGKAPIVLLRWATSSGVPQPVLDAQVAAVVDLMARYRIHAGWVSLGHSGTSSLFESHGGGYWFKDSDQIEGYDWLVALSPSLQHRLFENGRTVNDFPFFAAEHHKSTSDTDLLVLRASSRPWSMTPQLLTRLKDFYSPLLSQRRTLLGRLSLGTAADLVFAPSDIEYNNSKSPLWKEPNA